MFDLRSNDEIADVGDIDENYLPPALHKGGGKEPERCMFCDRITVSRCGGFCRNWDQIFGCPHEAQAVAHIMSD